MIEGQNPDPAAVMPEAEAANAAAPAKEQVTLDELNLPEVAKLEAAQKAFDMMVQIMGDQDLDSPEFKAAVTAHMARPANRETTVKLINHLRNLQSEQAANPEQAAQVQKAVSAREVANTLRSWGFTQEAENYWNKFKTENPDAAARVS